MLTYSQMLSLCEEVKKGLRSASLLAVREIGDQKWVISFDGDKQLLICLKTPFSRFHLTARRALGKSTPFTEEIEKVLKGEAVQLFSLLGGDRILSIEFGGRAGNLLVFELLPKHTNAYLLDGKWKIIAANHPVEAEEYQLPKLLKAHPKEMVICRSVDVEQQYGELEKQAHFEERKQRLESFVDKRMKRLTHSLKAFRDEWTQAKTWPEEEHLAALLKANFYRLGPRLKEIEVDDWDKVGEKRIIQLDLDLTPAEELEKRFKLIKKMRRTEEKLGVLIPEAEAALAKWEELRQRLAASTVEKELEALEKESGWKAEPTVKREKPEAFPYRRFLTAKGMEICVGRSDEENDALTFSIARGSDLWFHAANYPGSHVVLRVKKGQKPDEDSIADAMQLALYFSKGKGSGMDDITMTECKYVSKPKGAKKGLVNVSKRKEVFTRLNQERLNHLISSRDRWAPP